MFFIAFLPSQGPIRETEGRDENGVMGFLFLGGCVAYFVMFFGTGWNNLHWVARAGGRGVAVCIYVSYLYLVFVEMMELERLFIVQLLAMMRGLWVVGRSAVVAGRRGMRQLVVWVVVRRST